MYRVLNGGEKGNVGIMIEGKWTQDDYELLITYIDHLRQEVGPVRLLYDMTKCDGINSQALWEALTRRFQQFHEIIRIAVVGDRHWMECGTKVFHPILKTTVNYFTPDQRDKAWEWMNGDET